MILTRSFRQPASRSVAILAAVAAFSGPARAQGPTLPPEPAPAAHGPAVDGAALLAANVARMSAASAPRAVHLPFTGSARTTGPFATMSVSARGLRDSLLVSIARTAVGTRYVRGGQSFEGGFDCSGLVRYVMAALHVSVPRTAAQQAAIGVRLQRDTTSLRPGDLLTFGRSPRSVTHIGIYLGNGRYVHASSVAGQVIESPIDRPHSPLIKPWRGTRRVLSDATPDSTSKGGS